MNHIHIPFISSADSNTPLEQIDVLMDSMPKHAIDNEPWPQFKSTSAAAFAIAHCGDAVLLKYYVKEDVIRSVMYRTNDPVHKDNCVEFFIALEAEQAYYNIEMNCFGICSMGYRFDGEERRFLPEGTIEKIRRNMILQSVPAGSGAKYEWQLTVIIPAEVFIFSQPGSLTGKKARANFFKCGDDLPNPHFLSWNRIVNDRPDFHLPEFFGTLEFGRTSDQ